MENRKLGAAGLSVSKICLGTMTWGQQNTEEEAHEQLDFALEKGVNFVDTAELYPVPPRAETQGLTERYIGSWLRKHGRRAEIVLASKIVGDLSFAHYIRNPLGFKKEMLADALGKSLDRLQTDYLDLYQLHWPNRQTNFFGKRGYEHNPNDPWEDDFLEVLHNISELMKTGQIRHWGLSNETPWGLMRILHLADTHNLPRPITIQNPYSLVNRTFDQGLAEICIREQISCLPYSPMAFGVLSGKYHRGTDEPANRLNLFGKQWPKRYLGENTRLATAAYVEIADRHGLSMAQMALAFVNDRPFVGSNIIGATGIKQLAENIDSAYLKLNKEVLEEIAAVHDRIPNPAP